jgi:hypothetical protein
LAERVRTGAIQYEGVEVDIQVERGSEALDSDSEASLPPHTALVRIGSIDDFVAGQRLRCVERGSDIAQIPNRFLGAKPPVPSHCGQYHDEELSCVPTLEWERLRGRPGRPDTRCVAPQRETVGCGLAAEDAADLAVASDDQRLHEVSRCGTRAARRSDLGATEGLRVRRLLVFRYGSVEAAVRLTVDGRPPRVPFFFDLHPTRSLCTEAPAHDDQAYENV